MTTDVDVSVTPGRTRVVESRTKRDLPFPLGGVPPTSSYHTPKREKGRHDVFDGQPSANREGGKEGRVHRKHFYINWTPKVVNLHSEVCLQGPCLQVVKDLL